MVGFFGGGLHIKRNEMKKDTLKIILVVLLVLAVPGGIVLSYILMKKKKAVVDVNALWVRYTVGSERNNPDDDNDYDQLFYIDDLMRIFGTTRAEFYDVNTDIDKRMTYIPYGRSVLLPKRK